MDDYGILFLLVPLAVLLLFALLRELSCWYYKTNRIISMLEELVQMRRAAGEQDLRAGHPASGTHVRCPHCGDWTERAFDICSQCKKLRT